MKRKINKLNFAVILICLLLGTTAMFAGCYNEYTYRPFEDGDITGGYCKHNAFVGACYWDGGDKVIEIPDEYKNLPVTSLGGHTGWLGTDNLFDIVLRDNEYSYCGDTAADGDEYETLVFTIKIGKNLRVLEGAAGRNFVGYRTFDEDGHMHIDVIYKITYYFEVDSENEVFYSKDGKLYDKNSDKLVGWLSFY